MVSEQADGGGRMFLVHHAEPGGFGQRDVPAIGGELALDELEQGGLAGAVTPDQPHFGPDRQRDGGAVEEATAPGVEHEVFDLKHAGAYRTATENARGVTLAHLL